MLSNEAFFHSTIVESLRKDQNVVERGRALLLSICDLPSVVVNNIVDYLEQCRCPCHLESVSNSAVGNIWALACAGEFEYPCCHRVACHNCYDEQESIPGTCVSCRKQICGCCGRKFTAHTFVCSECYQLVVKATSQDWVNEYLDNE